MKEIWKDIEGYEGLYQISNTGKVKSLSRIVYKKSGKPHSVKEKLLSIKLNSVKYLCANLWKNNKGYSQPIHILLAKVFIPNPENFPYVCHKDDIKTNNNLDNLYWGTNSENIKDSIKNGNRGIGSKHINAALTSFEVLEIRHLLANKVKQKDIAQKFKVSTMIISDIKLGKTYKNEI